MYKRIIRVIFLLLVIVVQRALAASYLERTYEDIIHCRHLIERAYDNGVYNLSSGIADKYEELKHFCRFESVKEAKENPAAFRAKKEINEQEFLLKLGHIYKGKVEERTIIVFRGSQCRDEWVGELGNLKGTIAAAEALHHRVPGMIHEGFLHAVGQFYPAIQECMDIDAIRRPNHEILVTGHSRGAAFALLVGVRLQSWFQDQGISDTKNRLKIITFSAPEKVIGDDIFWKHVYTHIGKINIIKIYNDLDLVPKISLGNLADYDSPQDVFSIKIPIWGEETVPAYTEKLTGVLLRYKQRPDANFLDLFTDVITESVIFPHGMQGDSILKKAYKEHLPEYAGRWIQELYFPKVLFFISKEHEVSKSCVEYLINIQRDHNSKNGHPLIAQEVTSFLRGSEDVLHSSSSEEERKMRCMHFIIRWGVYPMTISSLLKDVEINWRRSIGLSSQQNQGEETFCVNSEEDISLAIETPIDSLSNKGKELRELSIGSDTDDIEIAKKQSLKNAEGSGNIGPREIPGWELEDVEDRGNCFYDAVGLQMEKINHSIVLKLAGTTLLRDLLRSMVQGKQFKDQEWADHIQIDSFVKMFDVILAVVDTRIPEVGFTYYFLKGREVMTKMPGINEILLPQEKQTLKIATTGNHFLSVVNHPVTT